MFDDSDPSKVPAFDCLAATSGSTGLGFSVTFTNAQDPGSPDWMNPNAADAQNANLNTFEIDETTGLPIGMKYQLTTPVQSCRIVGSPTSAGGYNIAFQSDKGIGFATYDPPVPPASDGNVTTHRIALPAADFGGPLNVPVPVWISAAGSDVSIGLTRTAGPQVSRFTYQNMPHGSTLPLRSERGQTGPVAASVGTDGVYVTYTDEVASRDGGIGTARYVMRIDSPDTLP